MLQFHIIINSIIKNEVFLRITTLLSTIWFIGLYTPLLIIGCIFDSAHQSSEKRECVPDHSISGPFIYVNGNDTPWINPEDIDFYDFSTHIIYLKKNKSLPFEEKWTLSPSFKVIANKSICLEGTFWSNASSFFPKGPVIYYPRFYPADMVKLPMMSAEDENLQIFKSSLVSKCLFHAGIECLLDSVYVFNDDGITTVEYTYTINNLDKDDLYLLDPDKAGSSSFHYFTHGVLFVNDTNKHHYGSSKKTVTSPSSMEEKITWLTKLKSKESMKRTVKLPGYENIIPGMYECSFTFPSCGIAKEMRQLGNGRVWEGNMHSSKVTIKVIGQ